MLFDATVKRALAYSMHLEVFATHIGDRLSTSDATFSIRIPILRRVLTATLFSGVLWPFLLTLSSIKGVHEGHRAPHLQLRIAICKGPTAHPAVKNSPSVIFIMFSLSVATFVAAIASIAAAQESHKVTVRRNPTCNPLSNLDTISSSALLQ